MQGSAGTQAASPTPIRTCEDGRRCLFIAAAGPGSVIVQWPQRVAPPQVLPQLHPNPRHLEPPALQAAIGEAQQGGCGGRDAAASWALCRG